MTVPLVIVGILLLVLAWFFLSGRDDAPEPTTRRHAARGRGEEDEIDYAELEEAEREVQEAPDEESVRDWGPGVRKPPIA